MLQWSNVKPTSPGWYWYSDEFFGPAPIEISWTGFIDRPDCRQLDVTWPQEEDGVPCFEDANGQWLGPIDEPDNPSL